MKSNIPCLFPLVETNEWFLEEHVFNNLSISAEMIGNSGLTPILAHRDEVQYRVIWWFGKEGCLVIQEGEIYPPDENVWSGWDMPDIPPADWYWGVTITEANLPKILANLTLDYGPKTAQWLQDFIASEPLLVGARKNGS